MEPKHKETSHFKGQIEARRARVPNAISEYRYFCNRLLSFNIGTFSLSLHNPLLERCQTCALQILGLFRFGLDLTVFRFLLVCFDQRSQNCLKKANNRISTKKEFHPLHNAIMIGDHLGSKFGNSSSSGRSQSLALCPVITEHTPCVYYTHKSNGTIIVNNLLKQWTRDQSNIESNIILVI